MPEHLTPVFPVFWEHNLKRFVLKPSPGVADEDHALAENLATVAAQANFQPAAPKIYYVDGIWVEDTTAADWAANRDFWPYLTDGTHNLPLTPNVVSCVAGLGVITQIWPWKSADNEPITLPQFPISNSYYLTFTDTMAAAETGSVWVSYVHRSSEI